jgi:hypothetical protein
MITRHSRKAAFDSALSPALSQESSPRRKAPRTREIKISVSKPFSRPFHTPGFMLSHSHTITCVSASTIRDHPKTNPKRTQIEPKSNPNEPIFPARPGLVSLESAYACATTCPPICVHSCSFVAQMSSAISMARAGPARAPKRSRTRQRSAASGFLARISQRGCPPACGCGSPLSAIR